jgi:hypothetical protein
VFVRSLRTTHDERKNEPRDPRSPSVLTCGQEERETERKSVTLWSCRTVTHNFFFQEVSLLLVPQAQEVRTLGEREDAEA